VADGVKQRRATSAQKPARHRVIHLYGLTEAPGPRPESFRKLTGVDGVAAVEGIRCGQFVCWVSRVTAEEFAENLEQNMQDLDWLAAATTRHQKVLSAIADSADILPARFGIEFLHEKSLGEHVESRETVLRSDLDRIRGKEEWGVKVFALPSAGRAMNRKKIRSGKDYLQAKSALVNRSSNRAGPEFDDFAKSLQSVASEVAEGGKLAAARRDLQFHKTVLVRRSDRKKLENVVRAYAKKWKDKNRIECTGPWPAFSFVTHSDSF
jgi:hypothetical protein